jgi:hypothetical protein
MLASAVNMGAQNTERNGQNGEHDQQAKPDLLETEKQIAASAQRPRESQQEY